MEKTRLWKQTEEAFPALRDLNSGTQAEKDLAAMSLKALLAKVISPLLRRRIDESLRKYNNARLIAEIKAS